MDIHINIKKRHVYVLTAVILLFTSTMFVRGYLSGDDPPTFGHSANELDIDPKLNGQRTLLGNWLRSDVCQKDGTNCPITDIAFKTQNIKGIGTFVINTPTYRKSGVRAKTTECETTVSNRGFGETQLGYGNYIDIKYNFFALDGQFISYQLDITTAGNDPKYTVYDTDVLILCIKTA